MTDRITIHCWKCGSLQEHLLLPFSRSQECGACNADLHCCFGCKHYSANVSDNCKEDRAEAVTSKETANFCDFFIASTTAFKGRDTSEAEIAKKKLAELFGDSPTSPIQTENNDGEESESEADRALAELNRLFSKE